MSKTILATGLACLDVMDADSSEPPKLSAGGFPNALIILKQRGWNSIPAVDLGRDRAGDYVLEEFRQWELDLRFTRQIPERQTPIYVLCHQNGGHFYGKDCPYCLTRFPLFTPISLERAEEIRDSLPDTIHVFYFDKVSQAAIQLAQRCRERSALVVFEPNRIDDEELFRQSVAIADIMKYSRERRAGVQAVTDFIPIPLEIETAGSEGLLYRATQSNHRSEWRFLPSIPVQDFVDAAGAGDWLTAALIDRLAGDGDFYSKIDDCCQLEAAFIDGQRESAYNCRFAGARGSLYNHRSMLRGDDFCPFCRGQARLKG